MTRLCLLFLETAIMATIVAAIIRREHHQTWYIAVGLVVLWLTSIVFDSFQELGRYHDDYR